RCERIFRPRGFLFLPLQTNWIMDRLDLEPGAPLGEMRLLTADGRSIGGADAVVFLARQIWWAWPFAALAQSPAMHKLLDRGYRWIAAHRDCDHITCNLPPRRRCPGWIALIVLPLLALLTRNHVAPWQFMWLMTGAIFLGCKWLTFWGVRRQIQHLRVRANGKAGLWNMDKLDIAPRFAFAYSPNFSSGFLSKLVGSKANLTSIRGGFGMYYDHFGQGIMNTFDAHGSFGLSTQAENGVDQHVDNAPRYSGQQD